MGRKRKKKSQENLIGVIILVVALVIFAKITLFKDFSFDKDFNYKFNFENPFKREKIEVTQRSVAEEFPAQEEETSQIKEEDVFVNVFFTKVTASKDVYVAVSRKKPKTFQGSDAEYAIKTLISGPTKYEKGQGVYSEIPASTKLLSYKETPSKIIVNLSDDFEFGGGGDSLYKRVYQLIKTANHNTRKPVYLYIKGKQASVIGGEGLMLKQPLRSNSLDE